MLGESSENLFDRPKKKGRQNLTKNDEDEEKWTENRAFLFCFFCARDRLP